MDQRQINLDHKFASDEGQVRQANEDFYGSRMTANGYVFTVCDGMGGHVAGETASRLAVECIIEFFEEPRDNPIVAINDALRLANAHVFEKASANPELQGMGTTATVLLVNATDCYIGHVGDSRIYLKSQGKLNRLTKDHSFVQEMVDKGIITDVEMETHPKKNQILQAIGVRPEVAPTVCDAPIKPTIGDCFLLCSDGLNGMINDQQIEALIDPNHLQESCDNLIEAANNAGGEDNVTAMLVTITDSPHAVSVFKSFTPVVAETTIVQGAPNEMPPGKTNIKRYVVMGIIALAVLALSFIAYQLFGGEELKKEKKEAQQEQPSHSTPPGKSDSTDKESGNSPSPDNSVKDNADRAIVSEPDINVPAQSREIEDGSNDQNEQNSNEENNKSDESAEPPKSDDTNSGSEQG